MMELFAKISVDNGIVTLTTKGEYGQYGYQKPSISMGLGGWKKTSDGISWFTRIRPDDKNYTVLYILPENREWELTFSDNLGLVENIFEMSE